MTKEQAIHLYLSKRRESAGIIERLTEWSEGLTVRENAARLGMNRGEAHMMRLRYGLKARKEKGARYATGGMLAGAL